MDSTKKIIWGGAIVVILGLLIWWAASTQNQGGDANDVSIRLKWLHQAQHAGFYFADMAGFYKDAGLNVTLRPGGVDFPAIQMVASGSDQFGISGADQILLAREKGVPVVALAVIYQQTPLVIFSLAENNIDEPSDLIGKRVGVKYGQDEELIYRSTLRAAEIDEKSIEEIPVKYDLSLLIQKKVDALLGYSINEPFLVEKESGKSVNTIKPADYNVHYYADTLFTSEDMLQNNPDVVRKVVEASVRGWQAAVDNPDQAVSYTLEYSNKLTRDHETKMMNASVPLIRPDGIRHVGHMEQSAWQSMHDLLLEQGFLSTPIDVSDAFTTDFLP